MRDGLSQRDFPHAHQLFSMSYVYVTVRSLGSVALVKARDMKVGFHFDFFSLDFNEVRVQ